MDGMEAKRTSLSSVVCIRTFTHHHTLNFRTQVGNGRMASVQGGLSGIVPRAIEALDRGLGRFFGTLL